jgi:hypothetical protein
MASAPVRREVPTADPQDCSLCIATLLRTSPEQTLSFVNYHLGLGIDHIYLFFDDPQDPAIPRLQARESVTCIPCDDSYWQSSAREFAESFHPRSLQAQNARMELASIAALRLARDAGYSWMLLIDSDELLYSELPIDEVFRKVRSDADVIRFPILEAVPIKESTPNPFLAAGLFKADRLRQIRWGMGLSLADLLARLPAVLNGIAFLTKKMLARLLGCQRAFRYGYFKGNQGGKSAVRLSAPVRSLRTLFPHIPEDAHLNVTIASEAFILHFDCRGLRAWREKWQWRYTNPNLVTGTDLSPQRTKQFARFSELYERGDEDGLEAFYDELYALTPRQIRVLRSLGLLREIHLPDDRFRADA